MPQVTLLKMTSQCDLATIARNLYDKDTPYTLFTTWVDYADDATTRRIFDMRCHAHGALGNVVRHVNDPHTLQGIVNERLPEESGLIIDGLNFLTSNIMLRTNSDEEVTYRTTVDLLRAELPFLYDLRRATFKSLIVISADMQAAAPSTYQGDTYRKLLMQTNWMAEEYLVPDNNMIALSAGMIREKVHAKFNA